MGTAYSRRQFVQVGVGAAAGTYAGGLFAAPATEQAGSFSISLAAWSLHRAFQSNQLKLIDFPAVAKRTFGIEAVELVNTFFPSPTFGFLDRLKKRADEQGVKLLLIMVDDEGALAQADGKVRAQAVRNHHKWLDIAQVLGCHSVRVNLHTGTSSSPQEVSEDVQKRAADSLSTLVEYSAPLGINVIVENHGGISSNADALVQIMKRVNSPFCGTLPDFGNFPAPFDRYESVRKMMPYAKAVSAKCTDFDAAGNETSIDYPRMMKLVVEESGYQGHVGIEYEGNRLTEYEGIAACKTLLERIRAK